MTMKQDMIRHQTPDPNLWDLERLRQAYRSVVQEATTEQMWADLADCDDVVNDRLLKED